MTTTYDDGPSEVRTTAYGDVCLFFGGQTPRGIARWFWTCPSQGITTRSALDWATAGEAFAAALRFLSRHDAA